MRSLDNINHTLDRVAAMPNGLYMLRLPGKVKREDMDTLNESLKTKLSGLPDIQIIVVDGDVRLETWSDHDLYQLGLVSLRKASCLQDQLNRLRQQNIHLKRKVKELCS